MLSYELHNYALTCLSCRLLAKSLGLLGAVLVHDSCLFVPVGDGFIYGVRVLSNSYDNFCNKGGML